MFQSATILGPALGGLLYAVFGGPAGVYGVSVIACFIATVALVRMRVRTIVRAKEEFTVRTVLAGLHYIWTHKLILGAISLDLFAVLLGGAVALLPIYAREILRTGPWGLGLLRASPGIGAAMMAILLAYRPLRSRVGKIMLFCVAGFGAFTIVFGVSHSLTLSRSEEHTSELQSPCNLVCRLLLEKKNILFLPHRCSPSCDVQFLLH